MNYNNKYNLYKHKFEKYIYKAKAIWIRDTVSSELGGDILVRNHPPSSRVYLKGTINFNKHQLVRYSLY